MKAHHIDPMTQPDTYIDLDDYINETPASLPTHRAARFLAKLGLAIGIGLAVMLMLSTWLSLSAQPTNRGIPFVVHPEAQTLSTNELEHMGISPPSLDDILPYF